MITFNYETSFVLEGENFLEYWVDTVVCEEGFSIGEINYIFCDDEYLHKLNVEYLQHDTLTDVITFPYSKSGKPIEGDVFISIDRIKENAEQFNITFLDELHRVIVHGALHLAGYGDKTPEEATIIRAKEDFHLEQFNS